MVELFKESVNSDFEGTIIDIETIGEFDEAYPGDSRRYRNITPVILGSLTRSQLKIYFIRDLEDISGFKKFMSAHVTELERPLLAFNCRFETGVLYHFCNVKVGIERELNARRGEAKWYVVGSLGLDKYDDPFDGSGLACKNAWLRGEIDKCVQHNRSCLLTERDLLLERGFREPDEVKFML
jgi:hypothetical protein